MTKKTITEEKYVFNMVFHFHYKNMKEMCESKQNQPYCWQAILNNVAVVVNLSVQ